MLHGNISCGTVHVAYPDKSTFGSLIVTLSSPIEEQLQCQPVSNSEFETSESVLAESIIAYYDPSISTTDRGHGHVNHTKTQLWVILGSSCTMVCIQHIIFCIEFF